MFAVLSTFSLLAFVVGAGFVTPILLSLLERARQRTGYLERQLQRHEEVIRERDTTINAYREAMALQMNTLESLRLPPLEERGDDSRVVPATLAST